MSEAIRLVIWDLDETFWQGTITEGGHRYNQATHDIVLELARRGIMSSICSKNDHEPVRAILTAAGLWDSFIFPSINWEPKGPRIAALIEAVQLRAPTVLFIDDNPSNLNEACHFAPGLQTADETVIPTLLDDPRLRGKDDRALSRLAQYKLLERRRSDEQAAGGSNIDFLRASHIRVRIERDIEANIDRAIELINRTNQLNFTKRRLPEAPEAARAALRKVLNHHMVQAGLLEVSDAYGDHGYCGFYLTRAYRGPSTLEHFCFSCRVMGMGVEAWAYQLLGRPELAVSGKVLSDPKTGPEVDWITVVTDLRAQSANTAPRGERSSFAARGGCVLTPLEHYFAADAKYTIGEFNRTVDGVFVKLDHSLCFRLALDGITPQMEAAAELLGYQASDFTSRYFEHAGPRPVWLFSSWTDLGRPILRHRETGARFPSLFKAAEAKTETARRIQQNQAAHFEPDGFLSRAELMENLRAVFSRVPPHGMMFVLLALESYTQHGTLKTSGKRTRLNEWTRRVAGEFPNVHTLDMADFIVDEGDVKQVTAGHHFSRKVYFRIYQRIRALLEPVPEARVA